MIGGKSIDRGQMHMLSSGYEHEYTSGEIHPGSNPHAFRREYAKVHCGADEVMDPFQENVQERLWTLTKK